MRKKSDYRGVDESIKDERDSGRYKIAIDVAFECLKIVVIRGEWKRMRSAGTKFQCSGTAKFLQSGHL